MNYGINIGGVSMVDTIMQSVAGKLSALPYVEAIVLGGLRARGTYGAYS